MMAFEEKMILRSASGIAGRLLLSALLFSPAIGCPSVPQTPASETRDFAALHSMMGNNQKLVFALQSHIGDPPEREAVRRDLDRLAAHFESIQKLNPYDDREKNDRLQGWSRQIAGQMRELESTEWTAENRKE